MQKSLGRRGSAPDPSGAVYDAPLHPLVGWGGGNPLPIPHPPHSPPSRRLRHLDSRFVPQILNGTRYVYEYVQWGPTKYLGLGPLKALIRPWAYTPLQTLRHLWG